MTTKNVKSDILRRAKIIQGHLRRVVKMIEDEEYCIDIVNQSLAVQNALKKIDEIILEDHLKTCVVDRIKKGQSEEAAKEVMEVFKRKEK